jgi:hypothetical protein
MSDRWPALPLSDWRDTYATLHMWMQIVGKICLALTPRTNHFWNVAFHVTARGLITAPLNARGQVITMLFDFVDHELVIQSSSARVERVALRPQTVAEFYRLVMEALHRLGADVRIWPRAVEVPDPVRLDRDETHRSYDRAPVDAFWRIVVNVTPVLEAFRCEFIGKSSPVHFFWGSFDLAVTRFSGRRAPERPDADAITRESYSHEVISHGFWPGSGPVAEPAFYAYAAPEPSGLTDAAIRPAAAFYSADLHEFILPYDAVRTSATPREDLTAFLTSTYDAAATLAGWNRAELERKALTV